MHPTSLPGRYGIGDLGPEAYRWIDFLHDSGMGLWQILPLGPTGYADSPYQCFSAFAGNPYLISPDILLEQNLITFDDLKDIPDFPEGNVDFGQVIERKMNLLQQAFDRFSSGNTYKSEFIKYQESNSEWLDDFTLFMALKDIHDLKAWVYWEPAFRSRKFQAMAQARDEYKDTIAKYAFYQFIFTR